MAFIHLRVHTAYSLAEGAIHIKKIPSLCQKQMMPAIGITDTNNLFGALEIATLCKDQGIQAIIGIQVTLKSELYSAPIVLLASNESGYKNLLKLASLLYAPSKEMTDPHITFLELKDYSEGVICLTGASSGPLGELILKNKIEDAKELLISFKNIFHNHLYMELQRHGLEVEHQTEPYFIEWALDLNIPFVATNNVFFATPDMYEAHDALLCIAEGRYLVDTDRRKVTPEHYLKSEEEMTALFSDIPEAVSNTVLIAKRCHFTAKGHKPILPRFPTKEGRSEVEELRERAYEGLKIRLYEEVFFKYSEDQHKEIEENYLKRLEYELDIVEKMGFPGYFLIVADFIQWAKNQKIPVGPGRGSGAGSLVAWVMTITDMDPIYFGLIFERFLNPERVSMPDFDVDFCQDRRDEVIKYVCHAYGVDRVAHIITFGKLQARAVLRDVGRVLQIPYGQVGKICDLVPNNPANPVTLEQAIEMEPLLQKAVEEEEAVYRLVEIGKQLEGLYRHASTHAAGVVIGDRPLSELIPLYRDEKSELSVTQFNMKYVEQAGLVKFDFLGLKTLTVIEYASSLIREKWKSDFKIQTISLDDSKTFKLLEDVSTVGIFQLESGGMKDVIRKLRPDRFEDLIALVALYRPGPMDDIPRYVACKHGEELVRYLHPSLEPILAPTYGVMVYQEQVMHIAQVLGGYSLGAADLLRRAMGKKIKSEMDAQRDLFTKGAIQNDIPQNIASQIFDQMAKFAGYGFNKSHSAPYALLAYQTAYLKANYPLEFYAASMTYDIHNTEKLNIFRQDVEDSGLTVLSPDINESHATFWVDHEKNAIRYALGAIKNVGIQLVDLLVQERLKNGKFKSIDDFIKRVDPKVLNKRMLESLISAGAFDCIHKNRQQLFKSVDVMIRQGQIYFKEKQSKQATLFGAPKNTAGSEILLTQSDDFLPLERLQNEFLSLGYYLCAHPLDIYKNMLPGLNVTPSTQLQEKATTSGVPLNLAGVLLSKQEKTSKAGNKFSFIKLSDASGIFESVLFSEKYTNLRDLLEEGRSFYIEANVKKDPESEEIRIMVNNMTPLDAMHKSHDLFYSVPADKDISSFLSFVKKQEEGQTAIVLRILSKDNLPIVEILLSKKIYVTPQIKTHLLSLVTI
ncbi:MAG: DNA polymerase III subunit alpha [Proteobacteria bacterium]|nr:DNA polymerase III subunit alpha [Pseudomonadota bacterium]